MNIITSACSSVQALGNCKISWISAKTTMQLTNMLQFSKTFLIIIPFFKWASEVLVPERGRVLWIPSDRREWLKDSFGFEILDSWVFWVGNFGKYFFFLWLDLSRDCFGVFKTVWNSWWCPGGSARVSRPLNSMNEVQHFLEILRLRDSLFDFFGVYFWSRYF